MYNAKRKRGGLLLPKTAAVRALRNAQHLLMTKKRLATKVTAANQPTKT
jgi:hypothetical protein